VANIDANYEGVVKARNDFFRQQGLTIDTHFIASTGIGGRSETRNACVAIDFLSVPNITLENQKFLKALEHLNPTHEYGVAFERGTQLKIGDKSRYFISGTASIDKHGDVLYLGDVKKQMERLLENIDALLKDGEACVKDTQYFIIYLRDISDKDVVETYMSEHYPGIPHIVLFAPVCRPQWLIEMECIAEK
jgi:enamine deaminase RidA (YjgF/YER057c/UK114 family)